MTKFTESELIPFALKIINNSPEGIDTTNLLNRLREELNPDGEDIEKLSNRTDDKFSQKVRNLKSHKTLESNGFANFSDNKFYITEKGIDHLKQLSEILNDIKNISKTSKKEMLIKKLLIDVLKEWPLSYRAYNVLKDENIRFVGDLLQYDLNQLLRLQNSGKKTVHEIIGYKTRLNLENINIDSKEWEEIKEEFLRNKKLKEIDEEDKKNQDILFQSKYGLEPEPVNKSKRDFYPSVFKDIRNFRENYFNNKKIKIDKELSPLELEKLIIADIEEILSVISDKTSIIFRGRYAYLENFKTLDDIGKILGVTRERIRQQEKNLDMSLKLIGKIDKNSLKNYFNKYEFISFHKLFPQLDKNFYTAKGTQDTAKDALVDFMEKYCGEDKGYFKTPERELWHFDIEKLNDIFLLVPSGAISDDFLEKIKDYYGYDNFVAKSALEFMENKNYIKSVNNKIFPIKMSKPLEVAHILIDYPNGLHWKKIYEIGNNSYTNNKWNTDRLVADHSINMISNKFIYLCEKGTYRLFRFCPENKNIDLIINEFINYLKTNNLEQSRMKTAFKAVIKKEKLQKLNFYDARAIIKKFGNEKGLYHSGKSATDTIGFSKKVQSITLINTIKNIFENSYGEITTEEINRQLQKMGLDTYTEMQLNKLVNQTTIFKIDPGTYINYEDGIKLCDKDEVRELLDKILSDYLFITKSFIREKINKELGYGLSSFYYDTLSKILAKENNWYYSNNYLSKKSEKTKNFEDYIKENYDDSLSTNENFEIVSKKIGMTKINFNNVVYYSDMVFDTDWVHQND